MSISTPNPSRGFVALPLEILEIPMSPGAFRALAEFCRMADADGYCWPSLEQLGQRLGRSRAAVSGYVKELRALSLLSTQEQRMANGYNYRLKYLVTFWKAWRAAFTKSRVSYAAETECSVKPAERPKGKNHIHKNHRPATRRQSNLEKLHEAWKAHIGQAPFPALQSAPPVGLVRETRALVAITPRTDPNDAEAVLKTFLATKGLDPDRGWWEVLRPALIATVLPDDTLMAALHAVWRPGWRRPPAPAFVEKLLAETAKDHPDAALEKLLSGYLRRWERDGGRLSSAAEPCNA